MDFLPKWSPLLWCLRTMFCGQPGATAGSETSTRDVQGICRCDAIRTLLLLLWDHFSRCVGTVGSIFSALASSRSPTGTPIWLLRQRLGGEGWGTPGHTPRGVADLRVLFEKRAKMAWPRENKYLHIRVHSQNDLLSFEL